MKLKTFILLILLAIVGYWGYGYVTTQFSQEAIAYKRYASALLKGDLSLVKALTAGELATIPFQAHSIRQERIGGDVRFVYYKFDSKQFSENGKTVRMRVQQIIRIDPPGTDSFFGSEVKREIHTVTLIQDQSAWKVESFQDAATSKMQSMQHQQ